MWRDRGFGLWAVERLDTGEFIGFIGSRSARWQAAFTPCVEVGWRLAKKHWGHGYAPEARYGLRWRGASRNVDLPDDEIVSFTTVANVKSQRVMEKIGMVHDRTTTSIIRWCPTGSERRHVLYRIDRRAN